MAVVCLEVLGFAGGLEVSRRTGWLQQLLAVICCQRLPVGLTAVFAEKLKGSGTAE